LNGGRNSIYTSTRTLNRSKKKTKYYSILIDCEIEEMEKEKRKKERTLRRIEAAARQARFMADLRTFSLDGAWYPAPTWTATKNLGFWSSDSQAIWFRRLGLLASASFNGHVGAFYFLRLFYFPFPIFFPFVQWLIDENKFKCLIKMQLDFRGFFFFKTHTWLQNLVK